ncbi:DUF4214 domain-containing protein [Marimonas sp. MJW-29]|uniref:DUF4214 domain-containing protein n=1 Tax=Sulfitobacter sediminis TaxID=3234186 RepID=A0ABV3RMT7_9RHOB
MTLSVLQATGLFVSPDIFGANVRFSATEAGLPTAAFGSATDALGVQNVRFGGDEADLNPLRFNENGGLPVDGVNSINIVDMPGGNLRADLVNFLEWCAASQRGGQPVTATLIIPTNNLETVEYDEFAIEIEAFVQAVMREYGTVISAFQIGSTFDRSGDAAYGARASMAAEAVQSGMRAAGYAPEIQPDILVQMADERAIAQLSDEAMAAIDGVTGKYFSTGTGAQLFGTDPALDTVARNFELWSDALNKDLDLHITDWKVSQFAIPQHGLVAGSSLIKQLENMVAIGADSAHVSSLDSPSPSALTLDSDGGAMLDAQGRLVNSAAGAVFDLMSETLSGAELIETRFDNAPDGIEVSAYQARGEVVFFISSRTLEPTEFTLDLGSALSDAGRIVSVKMSLDLASTDGVQGSSGDAASRVTIGGQPYFYNEDDADVILTDDLFRDASQIDLTLNPFEVVQLRVELDADYRPPVDDGGDAPVPDDDTPKDDGDKPKDDGGDKPKGDDGGNGGGDGAPLTSGGKHYILGTENDDLILLDKGVVYIDSGEGLDTVFVDALKEDLTFKIDGFGKPVMTAPGYAQEVTLANVERIDLSDGALALDTQGNSGQAYRLYQASFDRRPDQPGLEFWIDQLDEGDMSLVEVATLFLSSAEFEQAYGRNDALSDEAFLTLLYQNVLDRNPDAAGFAFWREQQENDLSRAEMLVYFSESEENQANVAGAIGDGIWYA